ncbi:MAG: DUF937 domain-containing protein [Bacteroidetes bacterium]|nr:DUF937 domain-containing protein [Bacteroidota bacterium]
MFDQIFEMVKGNLGEMLQGDENLADKNHEEVASAAGESLISKITSMAQNGDMSAVQEMFSGQETPADHPVMNSMLPDLQKTLAEKFGIDAGTAAGLAQKILPAVMNMFNQKAGQQGGFDISSIVSQLQNNGGIGDLIQKFTGNSDNKEGGNGLLDNVKKLFGG